MTIEVLPSWPRWLAHSKLSVSAHFFRTSFDQLGCFLGVQLIAPSNPGKIMREQLQSDESIEAFPSLFLCAESSSLRWPISRFISRFTDNRHRRIDSICCIDPIIGIWNSIRFPCALLSRPRPSAWFRHASTSTSPRSWQPGTGCTMRNGVYSTA